MTSAARFQKLHWIDLGMQNLPASIFAVIIIGGDVLLTGNGQIARVDGLVVESRIVRRGIRRESTVDRGGGRLVEFQLRVLLWAVSKTVLVWDLDVDVRK